MSADRPRLQPCASPAARVRVQGTVQGVGFRPYVYRLAGELGLDGWVLNDAHGVLAEVEGAPAGRRGVPRAAVARGAAAGRRRAGRRARAPARPAAGFEIRESPSGQLADAPVTPDTATCADCLGELLDPATGAIAIRSSTAPTAVRDSRSSEGCRTTGRRRRWRDFACARAAGASTRTRPTAAFTLSRMRVRSAGRRSSCSTPAARPWRGLRTWGCRAGGGAGAARPARSWRSRGSAATTSPAAPTTSPWSRRSAPASTGRTSRLR